jgi:hypothetical protein
MRIVVIGVIGLLVAGTVYGASPQEPSPSAADVLSVLSKRSGLRLTSVLEERTHRRDAGVWHVQADTAATRSASSGYCERVRVFAGITKSNSAGESWRVTEAEQARAVAVSKETSPPCEKRPSSAFIAIPDMTKPGDVELIMSAIDQLQPCAMQSEKCKTQIAATPWSLLDNLVSARNRPVVSLLEFDPNFSHGNLRVYNIQFTIDDTKLRYGADISIVDGSVKKIDVAEIVR